MLAASCIERLGLPADFLQRIAHNIAHAVPTERIYIFGSYARGEQRPDSDIDLYVEFQDSPERINECCNAARLSVYDDFEELGKQFDLIGSHRSTHESMVDMLGMLPNTVEREGVMIYGA